jgi:hypothetical protein
MRLTKKKKIDAMAENIRNAHALAKAMMFSLQMVKENLNLIENPEDVKCLKEMTPKVNYFIKRMNDTYNSEVNARRFIKEENGISHLDEISLRIIEATEEVLKNYQIK